MEFCQIILPTFQRAEQNGYNDYFLRLILCNWEGNREREKQRVEGLFHPLFTPQLVVMARVCPGQSHDEGALPRSLTEYRAQALGSSTTAFRCISKGLNWKWSTQNSNWDASTASSLTHAITIPAPNWISFEQETRNNEFVIILSGSSSNSIIWWFLYKDYIFFPLDK